MLGLQVTSDGLTVDGGRVEVYDGYRLIGSQEVADGGGWVGCGQIPSAVERSDLMEAIVVSAFARETSIESVTATTTSM